MFSFLSRLPRTAAAIAVTVGSALLVAPSGASAAVKVDPKLPEYEATSGISGTIKSVGSDSLNNLMTNWAEEFKKAYPNVNIEIEGKGSSTAPPALIQGTAQLGPMSRPMKAAEIDEFKNNFGYEPTSTRVAVDALAVFVHKDNPIESLSMDQLRQIFSVEGSDMTWGDVGMTGEWADQPISLYGRNSASGTYGFFKEHALAKKDFKPSVKEQPGSSAVVQAVASDKFGMGYSGIGYATADVRAVPVAGKKGAAVEANADNAYSGKYPLSRYLLIYSNVKPGEEPSPIVREFFKLVLSQQGQQAVVKDGYFPIPSRVVADDLAKLNIGAPAAAAAAAE